MSVVPSIADRGLPSARAALSIAAFAVVVFGCSSTVPATRTPAASIQPTQASTPSVQPTQEPAPTVSATPAAAVEAIACEPICKSGLGLTVPGALPAGRHQTANYFDAAFAITLDDGWGSGEDSTGELSLYHGTSLDDSALTLLFWTDIYARSPACQVNCVVPSADALLDSLRSNESIVVHDAPGGTYDGIAFQAIDIVAAADARSDVDCPAEIRPCVNLFGSAPWGAAPFNVAHAGPLRLYVADVEFGNAPHLMAFVVDDIPNQVLADAVAAAEPYLESMEIPARAVH